MRKVLSVLLPLFLCSFGLTAWGAEKSLKLGVIAELTGDMPAVGASCKNAAEMAVKEINAAGGVQVGKPVSYTHLDVYKRQKYRCCLFWRE